MGSSLPSLSADEFGERLLRLSPPAPSSCLAALYIHYIELCRWNKSLSLVGPGTRCEALQRHYGESLAALDLIPSNVRSILDVGSGAGFPGLVLAAARSTLDVTLVEPKQRKWAFLKTAVRRCGLSCTCLNVRVERPLPRELPRDIEMVTCRAVAVLPSFLEVLSEASPQVRFLFWCGVELPQFPSAYRVERQLSLAGSRHRRIVELRRA